MHGKAKVGGPDLVLKQAATCSYGKTDEPAPRTPASPRDRS
ncbi:hypothetical protein [Streptomyces subrutilus]